LLRKLYKMTKNYYILKSGKLRRKGNTLYLKTKREVKVIPINNINALFCFGEIDVNTKLLIFLTQNKIPVHFFNYYGFYVGSYYPRDYLNSGFLLVRQCLHYLDLNKRLYLAREIVNGSITNILKNLKLYKKHGKDVLTYIKNIENIRVNLEKANTIRDIMGIEGMCHNIYYQSFSKILRKGFELEKRTKRPPHNMLNALISFGNSLVYTLCLTEIYHTQLNPTISYLHEPSERRFSLSLDIAELFKPLISDRVTFKLINNQIINKQDFDRNLNYCYLKNSRKRKFLVEFDKQLNKTIFYKKLKRKVSYQKLVRIECYKLIKHLIGDELYKSFKVWW